MTKEIALMPLGRKQYTKPTVMIYGTVEEITLQGGRPNADLPSGSDGTAYSPG
jgi:hypothetical protein